MHWLSYIKLTTLGSFSVAKQTVYIYNTQIRRSFPLTVNQNPTMEIFPNVYRQLARENEACLSPASLKRGPAGPDMISAETEVSCFLGDCIRLSECVKLELGGNKINQIWEDVHDLSQ